MSLILLLLANSRQSYSELAEKLNLSVNAIHKRIQLLIETSVISKFTAKASIFASKAVVVYLFGTSQLNSFQGLPEKMKAEGSIYWLAIGGGKFLYIGAYLRDINELESLTSFVTKEAGIPEPTVGIMSVPYFPDLAKQNPTDSLLCDLDYRIIHSLKDDSRKAISDVADEIRVSSKTVRRRLARMIDKYLIELSLEWYPDKSNDVITLIDVHFKPETETNVAFTILKKYVPNLLFFWSFVNLPNKFTFVAWTNNMNELQSMREKLEKEESIASIVPNILYIGYIFNTWREKLGVK